MRFILNFIFYGVLFYLIYLTFPDAFFVMVSWANSIVEVLKDFYHQLAGKVQDWKGQRPVSTYFPQQAFLILLMGSHPLRELLQKKFSKKR